MSRAPPITVCKESNKVVECPKFSQSVAFRDCQGSKTGYGDLEIKGKCNCASLENCQFVQFRVDSVMSTLEVTNCKNVRVYLKPGAKALCLNVDCSDGVQIFLNEETSKDPDFRIVSSKSSEMNVSYAIKDEIIECPVPEQFVHKFNVAGGTMKLESSVSDIYSS